MYAVYETYIVRWLKIILGLALLVSSGLVLSGELPSRDIRSVSADLNTSASVAVEFQNDDTEWQPANKSFAMLNGRPSTRYPQVALLYRNQAVGYNRAHCTGTLIRPTVVLTAAHCFFLPHVNQAISQQQRQAFVANMTNGAEVGKWKVFFQSAGVFGVKAIEIPSSFRNALGWVKKCPGTDIELINTECDSLAWAQQDVLVSDVALVFLDRAVTEFPPAIIQASTTTKENLTASVFGYGRANTAANTNDSLINRYGTVKLQNCEDEVLHISGSSANGKFLCWKADAKRIAEVHRNNTLNASRISANDGQYIEHPSDICGGDSGGPVFKYDPADRLPILIGTVSSNYATTGMTDCSIDFYTGNRSIYSVASKVADHLEWIESAIDSIENQARKVSLDVDQSARSVTEEVQAKTENIKSIWSFSSRFDADNQRIHKYRLVISKKEMPTKILIALNGEKGNHEQKLSSVIGNPVMGNQRNEFDLLVSRERVVSGGLSKDKLNSYRLKGEYLVTQFADPAQVKRFVEQFPGKQLPASMFENTDYGDPGNTQGRTFEQLVDCRSDEPGQMGFCELSEHNLEYSAPSDETCLNGSCETVVWYVVVRRTAGQGEYQLTITTFI